MDGKERETAEEEIKPKTSDTILYIVFVVYRQQKIDSMQPMRQNMYIVYTITYTIQYHTIPISLKSGVSTKLSIHPENPPNKPISLNLFRSGMIYETIAKSFLCHF